MIDDWLEQEERVVIGKRGGSRERIQREMQAMSDLYDCTVQRENKRHEGWKEKARAVSSSEHGCWRGAREMCMVETGLGMLRFRV